MKATSKYNIHKYRDGSFDTVEDVLAKESRLTVTVNGQEVLSFFCTPLMVRELVVGFLLTEGIADGVCTERMTIIYEEDGVRVETHAEGEVRTKGGTVTSGCVGGVTFKKELTDSAMKDPFTISPEGLCDLFARFQKRSDLHGATGCIHSAAISDGEDIIALAEDIGRHNAVDKVLGYTILEGMDFTGKMMLASGRLSSEIVSKCAKWGIPMVASRTAPTALALDIAQKYGVTLVGFLRGRRFNVYTHPHRVGAAG